MSLTRRLLIAATALALTAPVYAQTASQPLRIAEMWEIPNLDPAIDGTLMKEKALITETLVQGNPDFTLAPGLAASWERTGDLTWIFKLRPNVKFHDGSAMDAKAVVASLQRALDRSATVKSYTKITALAARDDLTVEMTTAESYPVLPAALDFASTAIISMNSPKLPDGTVERPISTGPYKISDWQPAAQTLKAVRNDAYWGVKAAIPALEFRGVPDPTTRSLEIQKGDIDFVAEVPYGDLDMLKSKGFQVSRNVTARDYILNFGSLTDTPFADVRVRKALSAAIDREEIAQYALFGMGRAGIGPFAPNMDFADKSLAPTKFDLAQSKKLFAEAGYAPDRNGQMAKDGKPLTFTIYTYPQRPGLVPIAGAIQGQLRKVGVMTEVKVTTFDAIAKEMKPGDARLAAFATAMYPDPDFFLRQFYQSKGAQNIWGYRSEKVDAALATAITTRDEATRRAAYTTVQKLVAEDEPALVVAYYGVNIVMKPGVVNYTFNPIAHDYMLDPRMAFNK